MMTNQDTRSTREKENGGAATGATVPTVVWDDSSMKTSYANVVNAASTREEVTLFFGTNLTWNPGEAKQFHVRLSDRIVLNPYAAKRLWILIGAILKEYEGRFGALNMDVGAQDITHRAGAVPPS